MVEGGLILIIRATFKYGHPSVQCKDSCSPTSQTVKKLLMMDLRTCAIISLLETIALVPVKPPLALTRSFRIFIPLLLLQYAAVKIYRLFVYPFFFSPLRHPPGPTVSRKPLIPN
jgi:hypothetical protein